MYFFSAPQQKKKENKRKEIFPADKKQKVVLWRLFCVVWFSSSEQPMIQVANALGMHEPGNPLPR